MSNPASDKLIPAATILLVRDGVQGLEVFMVVRHHQIDFASGALVFPGGKVDPRDMDDRVRSRVDGLDGLDDWEFSMRVAAIREAYEECGVLLARSERTNALVNAAQLSSLAGHRDRLNKGEIGIGDMLAEERLRLAADLLTPFAHWITPNMMPKRFDTRFYVTAAPADHLALHDGHESVDSVWIRPSDAVREAEEGKRTIIFPTRVNVQKLGRFSCVSDAIETARRSRIVTVEPKIVQKESGPVLAIPSEADYDVTEEPLSNIRA
ncbi:MAG TPA: NUDIX domain-containing protein [Parvibaculum sp.]|uniref:NUDIX hydrolase n=1 Tax=Parvibaculum sp. TaxID=2024848 RepID=UPI002BB57563|nr:NUDIX hydrolase [Parvibaculum sp.]HMM14352.1 NUDIX domain-containing protein [Parvibaculum sp.]